MPRKKKNKDNSELDEVLDVDETDDEEKVKGGTLWTIIVAVVIIAIWLVIFGLLIKLDVGGFGSTVLRPILRMFRSLTGFFLMHQMRKWQLRPDISIKTLLRL